MKGEDVTREQLLNESAAMRQKITKFEKAGHQRKGSKETLVRSHIDFDMQVLLDAIPFYVMLIDADHKILLANKAVKSALDLDPEQGVLWRRP
jgi:PAS domain-containing protein